MEWIRKGLVVVALLAVAGPASAQRFGVQANWADDFDFGIGVRAELDFPNLLTSEGPFSRTFGIGSFDYFFPDCGGVSGFDCSYWEVNLGLAVPIVAASVDPYVGAGLNIARFSADYDEVLPGLDFGASSTDVGVNLLGGLRFPLGGLSAYGEARIELGGGEQLVLTFGVLLGGSN
jgi:opacity protein-like surface antigen